MKRRINLLFALAVCAMGGACASVDTQATQSAAATHSASAGAYAAALSSLNVKADVAVAEANRRVQDNRAAVNNMANATRSGEDINALKKEFLEAAYRGFEPTRLAVNQDDTTRALGGAPSQPVRSKDKGTNKAKDGATMPKPKPKDKP